MASEGVSGLRATAQPGSGDYALFMCRAEGCLLGLIVFGGIRVISHLGHDA